MPIDICKKLNIYQCQTEEIKNALISQIMDNIAKVNGESAMLNQMIFQAFAKLAAKKKRKNNKV